jgi:DNA-binding transcriptional regulator YiaG
MSLPKEIKMIRQRLFLTQSDFAKALDVSYTTVNRWETGKARPNLGAMKSLKKFCEDNMIEYSDVEKAWLLADAE